MTNLLLFFYYSGFYYSGHLFWLTRLPARAGNHLGAAFEALGINRSGLGCPPAPAPILPWLTPTVNLEGRADQGQTQIGVLRQGKGCKTLHSGRVPHFAMSCK